MTIRLRAMLVNMLEYPSSFSLIAEIGGRVSRWKQSLSLKSLEMNL